MNIGLNQEYKNLTVNQAIEVLQKHAEQYSGESPFLLHAEDNIVTDNVLIVQGSNTSFIDGEPLVGYNPPIMFFPASLEEKKHD